MAKCWEQRGCDQEMQATCPHANELNDNCPTKCAFTTCECSQHELTTDPALVFDPEVDRSAAIMDVCTFCAFYLKHGPRVSR